MNTTWVMGWIAWTTAMFIAGAWTQHEILEYDDRKTNMIIPLTLFILLISMTTYVVLKFVQWGIIS